VPDRWLGVNLKPACRRHDWFYLRGQTGQAARKEDRLMADGVFKFDVFCALHTNKRLPLFYCRYFAWRRYLAVRFIGRWIFFPS